MLQHMFAVAVLGAASLLASGVVFRHSRVTTYAAAAGALFQAQWLLIALIDRMFFVAVPSGIVFGTGAMVCSAAWLWRMRHWQGLRWTGMVRRELAAALVLLPVALTAGMVVSVNGRQADGAIALHGFYNGDTVTLAALTERARLTAGMVRDNPFAGDAALEYPTLFHGALASLLDAIGFAGPVLFSLPALTLLQVLVIVPLLWLLWDVYWPEPAAAWQEWLGIPSRWAVSLGQAAGTLLVLGGVWDNFIYPQSHFFLTGLFLLLVCLLLRGYMALSQPLALVLLLANTVTGTAAAVLTAAAWAVRAVPHGAGRRRRLLAAAGGLLWLLLIPITSTGDAAFGWPDFYYSAAMSFAHAAPLLVLLVPALFAFGDRFRISTLAVAMLVMLAVVTFIFSTRAIIAENASRFVDHAVLLALPLLLPPLIQLWYWLKQRLRWEALPADLLAGRWAVAGSVAVILLLPAGVSMARAYDNLLLHEPQVISVDLQQILRILGDTAEADARVAAAPSEPFSVPLLTGRSLVRAYDYWLSPQDAVLDELRAAFTGDREAQRRIAARSDYLVLQGHEEDNWDVRAFARIGQHGDVSLFRTR